MNFNSINLNGKSILITGGTGSFGTEFIKIVLSNFKPKRLVIYSRDEQKQHDLSIKYNPQKYKCLRFFIGDVRDAERLEMAMKNIEIVVHAAAMKHVPTAEYNPFECINTNVYGAENIVRASLKNKVKKIINISTDKACNPINLYGASKLAAEKIFIAANNLTGKLSTKFSVVRYGNVLGSRGSVVNVWKDLIKKNSKEIPITDPEMTRFWIPIHEGVNFVLNCLKRMHGGEIFVPKIPSMKLSNFASALYPKIKKKVIGIRPGEKLHEVLINSDDYKMTIEMKDSYIIYSNIITTNEKDLKRKNIKKVKNNFIYQSNTNKKQLNINQLKKLIKK